MFEGRAIRDWRAEGLDSRCSWPSGLPVGSSPGLWRYINPPGLCGASSRTWVFRDIRMPAGTDLNGRGLPHTAPRSIDIDDGHRFRHRPHQNP